MSVTVSCPSQCFRERDNWGEERLVHFFNQVLLPPSTVMGRGKFFEKKKLKSLGRKTKSLTGPPPLLVFSPACCVSWDLLKVKEAILLTDGQHVISKDICVGAL